ATCRWRVPRSARAVPRARPRMQECRHEAGAADHPEGRRRVSRRRGSATMKAVIMAGGEGTRLRPLTSNQPKPMMPLVNRPMLEHIISLLTRHGFDDVVVTVAYLANQIRDYFGDGSDFGVRVRYAT